MSEFAPLVERKLIEFHRLSWNEALVPGSSSGINPEGSLTLERRKEAVIKKAKEYHKELEALLVRTVEFSQ